MFTFPDESLIVCQIYNIKIALRELRPQYIHYHLLLFSKLGVFQLAVVMNVKNVFYVFSTLRYQSDFQLKKDVPDSIELDILGALRQKVLPP